ncbi:tRNA uridine-5-carboxymethylaminomethyl(34) synthesis GTPase MnmE [Spiroplasma endosymbiont of Aspidapion aeneum]|uniref:tRNA uridine-5-carboxymethylaminomethyl(34) synthesis GTPase MnmE n=1 Tax=Spiroplasma endosymbiont of Aspidapion aeneum TaxID=3066276 RepID=UPI00313DD5CB
MKYSLEDTIVAPATSPKINQTIGIIRISGPNAIYITNKIILKPLSSINRVCLRKVKDNNKIIDECIFLWFINNKSFTGEEMVEINCHGNKKIVLKIIDILISNGCRMAENGEFSKRAYINGKIDLIQADAINRLINSKTYNDILINSMAMSKKNSNKIYHLKNKIIDIISIIQTSIDYPEYDDIEKNDRTTIKKEFTQILLEVNKTIIDNTLILKNSNGINVVIVGKPNVGKSSLFNSLIREDKAIVTDIEGTTRDIIEREIEYKDVVLNFADTAGIRETNNTIEKMGIEKSLSKIKDANIIIWVIDNVGHYNEHKKFINKNSNLIILLSKADKLKDYEKEQISKDFPTLFLYSSYDDSYIRLLDYLCINYSNVIDLESEELLFLSSYDNLNLFKKIKKIIKHIIIEIENEQFFDIIILSINKVLEIFNQILGIDNSNEIIDNIFKKYCLGK